MLSSTLPPLATIETIDKVGHGLIGAPRLHLVEASFLRPTLVAFEEPFLVRVLSLLLGPVRAPRLQVGLHSLSTLCFLHITRQLFTIHSYSTLCIQSAAEESFFEPSIILVLQIENQGTCLVLICFSVRKMSH